jgi:hypothetical protein
MTSPSPLRLTARLDEHGKSERVTLGHLRPGAHTYSAVLPAGCTAQCTLAALAVDHPGTDIDSASAKMSFTSLALAPPGGGAARPLPEGFGSPAAWRPGAPSLGGPIVGLTPGADLGVTIQAPGGPFAEIVHGDSPEPLPAIIGANGGSVSFAEGALPVASTDGLDGATLRYLTSNHVAYVPRLGASSVLVDLGLALKLDPVSNLGDREIWLSRNDPTAERHLRAELAKDGVSVTSRETRGQLERVYAGDGAVLALRLLLVCGAAAVVVAVGALLVAAYVGRRQRAYEVAALRVVGVRRRTVRGLLLRENVGSVVVAMLSGAAAALIATWVVLPALPQFDDPSEFVPVRYAPDAAGGWAAVLSLGLLLVSVGLVVAVLQLRTGRPDRLREGVR